MGRVSRSIDITEVCRPGLMIALAPAVLGLFAACSGGSGSGAGVGPQPTGNLALPSDEEILSMVYSDTYRTPPDFYTDPRSLMVEATTIHHIRNTTGMSAEELPDDPAPYELCTDDFDQALGWSEADNAGRTVSGALVDTVETARYFEFVRTLNGLPDWLGYGRI